MIDAAGRWPAVPCVPVTALWRLLVVVPTVVSTAFLAWAQDLQPTFSSGAELVVLHVTVKDRDGAYLTDLPPEAFAVFEDERPRPITVFTAVDSPVTVGLLLDSSGSMREGRSRVVAAATAFAAASHPLDELFALTFNETVRAVLPATAPFTSDPAALEAALARGIQAAGRTALHDAIVHGLEYVERGRHPRRVLIVVADGGDNASHTAFDTVLRHAQASNAAIYGVGVIDPVDRTASRTPLRELARATGGEAFFPRRVEDVADSLQHIASEIRHTYTLGFVPAETARPDVFHRLRVEVRAPGHRGLTVRTREGYRGGAERRRNG